MTPAVETLESLAGSYWDDPLGFVLDCFEGVHLDQWQIDVLNDIRLAVRERKFDPSPPEPKPVAPIRMAVASGHGIGKSTLMALLFWWIFVTRAKSKIRVTANTYTQLESTTWAEIRKWHKQCRYGDWFEVSGSMARHKQEPESWFALPITCAEENSDAFAGQHNSKSTSAFLFDESSLIPDVVWEVADNGLTDGEPMWFAFGNMTRNTGKFYEAGYGSWQHRWNFRSIDSRTCKFPNQEKIQQDIDDHGIDSDYVKVRIRGLPPAQSEDQLISRDLVVEAQKRKVVTLEDDPLVCGVDVPDGGSGWFVMRFRRGLDARPGIRVPSPVRIAGSRTDRPSMIAKCIQILVDNHPDRKIAAMFIDMGFGAAIVERLHSLGYENVYEVNFGGKSPDPRYGNMRAFMWGKQMKDWLQRGAIEAEDKKLAADITAPGFKMRVGGDGALLVESKDSLKSRGIASPDDGDALALTFAMAVGPIERPRQQKTDTRSDPHSRWLS